jgi:hypothetical protein
MLKKNAADVVDIHDERCLTNSADHPPEVRIGYGLDNVIHLGRLVPETHTTVAVPVMVTAHCHRYPREV